MKRALKLGGVVLGGLAATVLSWMTLNVLLLGSVVLLSRPEPTILQELPSPDGEYVAYVFELNSGATSGFVYRLSILKEGRELGKGNGNTFISGSEFTAEWVSDGVLQVNNGPAGDVYRQNTLVKGVEVRYAYPEERD